MLKRFMNTYIMIATIIVMAVGNSYAQSVPIPNPLWPMDSVVNGAVHRYFVQGDEHFEKPSTFHWFVEGGRFFHDPDTLNPVAGETEAVVLGTAENFTELYVVWDRFDKPLDTGYVYLYEVSADGCERSDLDAGKFQGIRIKVSAPPKVRFLKEESILCSNEEGVVLDIEIEGMPPFDLTYSINDEIFERYIQISDLVDSDFDGEKNNITIVIDDYPGNIDTVYQCELLEASSGGVMGKILDDYPTHTVYAFVQPPAPEIMVDRIEVTTGERHTYLLTDQGQDPDTWYWELYDESGNMLFDFNSSFQSFTSIDFMYPAGTYWLNAYYLDKNGCVSLDDSLEINVFNPPTIAFADTSLNMVGCSEVSINPNEFFTFTIHYEGARSYEFTYDVYDYNGVLIDQQRLEYQTGRTVSIQIPNTFINDEIPEMNRTWKVKIVDSVNEEGVNVNILDSNIEGGRDERLIIIHPKPIIHRDIDFVN